MTQRPVAPPEEVLIRRAPSLFLVSLPTPHPLLQIGLFCLGHKSLKGFLFTFTQ